MQRLLDYRSCLGLDKIDRFYHVSAGDINPATGKAYAINPASGVWDDNYFATHYGGASNGGGNVSAPSTQDIIGQAQALRDFNVKNNQPAIQTLQTASTDLQGRYKDLLGSIKGQQTVAENQQITATSNELGKRGINNQSGLYQQEQANALRPIDAQYQGLSAQTGVAEQGQLNDINNTIGSLQAGNPLEASQLASGNLTNVYNIQQQAANLQSQIAANKAIADLQLQYREIPYGGGLYNTSTGQNVASSNVPMIQPLTGGGYNSTSSSSNTTPNLSNYVTNGPPLNVQPGTKIPGLTYLTPISY